MGNDVLSQFRTGTTAARPAAPPMRSAYEAFRKSDRRQQRLKVRPARRAWERVSYGYLQHITEDGVYGTQLGLVYSFCVVVIKGRNLQAVSDAIDAEMCECIQQFDADRWEVPTDPKAPYIESIAVHVQTRVEAMDKTRAEIEAARQQPPV